MAGHLGVVVVVAVVPEHPVVDQLVVGVQPVQHPDKREAGSRCDG